MVKLLCRPKLDQTHTEYVQYIYVYRKAYMPVVYLLYPLEPLQSGAGFWREPLGPVVAIYMYAKSRRIYIRCRHPVQGEISLETF